MTKFLRTVSTRRLLALIVGLITAVAAGTAIALAAAGTGPVPRPSRLPTRSTMRRVRRRLTGITARISFTNHLIDSTDIQGGDPILTGPPAGCGCHDDHRLRLELQSDTATPRSSSTVARSGSTTRRPIPSTRASCRPTRHRPRSGTARPCPTVAQIQSASPASRATSTCRGRSPATSQVTPPTPSACRPSTTADCSARDQIAWDASAGSAARSRSTPVATLAGPRAEGDRHLLRLRAGSDVRGSRRRRARRWSRVRRPRRAAIAARHEPAPPASRVRRRRARRLSFKFTRRAEQPGGAAAPFGDPARLGGSPAALVTYGQNLGGVAVIEQTAASANSAPARQSGDQRGLNLPTVSIHGTTAQDSTPRSERWSASRAAASPTRPSDRSRPRRRTWPRGRCDRR